MNNEALETQVGGSHYKDMKIQPMEFMLVNMSTEELIGVLKFNVTKYVWREKKDRMEDWSKAKHYIELIQGELNSREVDLPVIEEPPLTDEFIPDRRTERGGAANDLL
jgi:hypothetical protein